MVISRAVDTVATSSVGAQEPGMKDHLEYLHLPDCTAGRWRLNGIQSSTYSCLKAISLHHSTWAI